jgi:hypothetical protein
VSMCPSHSRRVKSLGTEAAPFKAVEYRARVLAARQEAAGLFRGRTRKRSMYSSVKTCGVPELGHAADQRRSAVCGGGA